MKLKKENLCELCVPKKQHNEKQIQNTKNCNHGHPSWVSVEFLFEALQQSENVG